MKILKNIILVVIIFLGFTGLLFSVYIERFLVEELTFLSEKIPTELRTAPIGSRNILLYIKDMIVNISIYGDMILFLMIVFIILSVSYFLLYIKDKR
jgi:hypothetical protein